MLWLCCVFSLCASGPDPAVPSISVRDLTTYCDDVMHRLGCRHASWKLGPKPYDEFCHLIFLISQCQSPMSNHLT
jgi:hypothetical protein